MARAKKDQYCKDCKFHFMQYSFSSKCSLTHTSWTSEVSGDTFPSWDDCYDVRNKSTCDFQPMPTMWERIKAVIIG